MAAAAMAAAAAALPQLRQRLKVQYVLTTIELSLCSDEVAHNGVARAAARRPGRPAEQHTAYARYLVADVSAGDERHFPQVGGAVAALR